MMAPRHVYTFALSNWEREKLEGSEVCLHLLDHITADFGTTVLDPSIKDAILSEDNARTEIPANLMKAFEGKDLYTVSQYLLGGPPKRKAHEEIEVNEKGGKQSKLNVRYDLVSPIAINALAQVLAYGASKYDAWNWEKIPARDHINHSINHLYKYLSGDDSEKFSHLWHAFCRAMMAVHMAELEKQDASY